MNELLKYPCENHIEIERQKAFKSKKNERSLFGIQRLIILLIKGSDAIGRKLLGFDLSPILNILVFW